MQVFKLVFNFEFQCTEQKDIAIRLCPTPAKDDDVLQNDSSSDEKPSKLPKSIHIDEQWICQHAKQVYECLCIHNKGLRL